jgi:hypothetical protein
MAYNGYKNYETWNIMLYVNNDKMVYDSIKNLWLSRRKFNYDLKKNYKTLYECWVLEYEMFKKKTPDGVSWGDKKLDFNEINQHLEELFNNEK